MCNGTLVNYYELTLIITWKNQMPSIVEEIKPYRKFLLLFVIQKVFG